jgi:hypothetical protein
MKNFFRYAFITGSFLTLTTWVLQAQTTSVQLPTEVDSSSSFRVLNSAGITRMQVDADGGLYLGGAYPTGVIPIEGMGTRLMWYPRKAAFRAGHIDGTQWNDANIGDFSMAIGYAATANGNTSTAMGYSTTASGNTSTAMGYSTTASGNTCTAMGYSTTASGNTCTAMGSSTTASSDYSTAIGYQTTASGDYSTAMGKNTNASGVISTAMGEYTTASGQRSVAIGCADTASGWYSTAMGYRAIAGGDQSIALGNYVSTDTYAGACIIGDGSTGTTTHASASNQMTMRFSGGYRLFTNIGVSIGASLAAGANSWATISDSTKKEHFNPAHGEYFLKSLSQLRLGSWNYKAQDSKSFRHYGPMAQEIFQYFGKDAYGTIGNDTTLSTADMDGIMMICLQALEKRTTELNNTLNELKAEREKTVQMQASFDELKKEIAKIKGELQSLTESKTGQTGSNVTLNTIYEGFEK